MWRGGRGMRSQADAGGNAAGGPRSGPGSGAGSQAEAVTQPRGRVGQGSILPPNGTSAAADTTDADSGAGPAGWPAPRTQVPGWLQRAAAWSWRLLILGVVIYLAFRVASLLRVVVLPCVAALLLTALLQPLLARLRRLGLPNLAATWCTLLIAVAVIAGVGFLAATRTSADYPTLVNEVRHSVHDLQSWLSGPPLHFRQKGLNDLGNRVLTFLKQHQSTVAGTVLTGGKIVLEVVAGTVLMLFVTFFLLKDGDRIWAWLVGFFSPEGKRRADRAGFAAWLALVYYVRGTIAVAAIHAVVIGLALWVMGVPLLVPLVILVFLAAFVPLVGILVAGALAVAVTLGTRGWIAAVVLIAIFILENQLESHLLQPIVVGRMVRLHPLAIILVLAVGGVVAGIPGAVVAVPTSAALVRAWPYLTGRGLSPPEEAECPGGNPPGTVPERR
jgi:predicted PurR-regulated permease PerM